MTLLAEDPELWDVVFKEPEERLRFVRRRLAPASRVLDVGCATGNACLRLAKRGHHVVGVDVNPTFIAAARAKDPRSRYAVEDMRALRFKARFDAVLCLGTTLAYAASNAQLLASLRSFRRALRPGGVLVVDVLNAAAFTGARPFRSRSQHDFVLRGQRVRATLEHRLELRAQRKTEQVTWRALSGKRWTRRDPEERLRLFFPQELAFFLECAGFVEIRLTDRYQLRPSKSFDGRRLIAVARVTSS